MKARLIFHGAAVVLLVATVAAAQTPKEPAKKTPASQSSNRESSAPSVSEAANSKVQTAREASSGMATGRHQDAPVTASADKSLSSAHATESVATPAPAAETVSSNPLYKGNQSAGSNPLYQSKEKQAAASSGAGHDVVEYKDGEDGITRTRPGNNKTSKAKPITGSGTPPPSR